MSLKDLINDTRNRWATLRVESLRVDDNLLINGNLAADTLAVNNLVVNNDANIGNNLIVNNDLDVTNSLTTDGLTVTTDATIQSLTANGNTLLTANLSVPNGGINTGGGVSFDGSLSDNAPDIGKSSFNNGPIYDFIFPFDNGSAANTNLDVKVKENGGLVILEFKYDSNVASINDNTPLIFNPDPTFDLKFRPLRPISTYITIKNKTTNPDSYFDAICVMEPDGTITISYKFGTNLQGWLAGNQYATEEYSSMSYLTNFQAI